MNLKDLIRIVSILLFVVTVISCSDNTQPEVTVPVENFYNTTTDLPISYFNNQTLKWLIIKRTYVSATKSELFSITQDVDFNFYNNTKAKTKVNKANGYTIINPQWDIFYTIESVRLVKRFSSIHGEVQVAPTYNTAGYPRKEFYLKNDSNGEISYYTVGSDNKMKIQ
jgi:hypothetical protein